MDSITIIQSLSSLLYNSEVLIQEDAVVYRKSLEIISLGDSEKI